MENNLPPGQQAISDFPRFGAPRNVSRLPEIPPRFAIKLDTGDGVARTLGIDDFMPLPRREIVADFHCVATWTHRNLHWEGYAFRDVYQRLIAPHVRGDAKLDYVEFKALDGYKSCIVLADLLDENVLLADRLQGAPLARDHGAPLRLIVPHLYGYKNVKHVCAIRLCAQFQRSSTEKTMRAHPRGRVALEERGRGLPAPIYRVLYRAVFPLLLWKYRRAERRLADSTQS
jgi:DMSO/TMAO reductase YedYZ molybdopterin-dependent catalytic subunit